MLRYVAVVVIFFLAALSPVNGQYAAIDALVIKNQVDPLTKKLKRNASAAWGPVLKGYIKKYAKDTTVSALDLTDAFAANPFLKGLMPSFSSDESGPGINGTPPGTYARAGIADFQTMAIDAIAKFIVERIRQELQAAFFERFYRKLLSPDFRDCQTLFPSTYRQLASIGTEIYQYEIYLQALRNAFGNDLSAILPNFETVVRSGSFSRLFESHKELRSITLTALYFGKNIRDGKQPGQIFEDYDPRSDDYAVNNPETNADIARIGTASLLKEISLSLKSKAGADYWIDDTEFVALKDPLTFTIYLGLLYERIKDTRYSSNLILGKMLTDASKNPDQLTLYFRNILRNVDTCRQRLKRLVLHAAPATHDYLAYFSSVTGIMESLRNNEPFSATTAAGLLPELEQVWGVYDKSIATVDNVLSAYCALKEKKYSVAVNHIRFLYRTCYPPGFMDNGQKTALAKLNRVIDFLFEYGTLVGEVAEADNSKAIYSAINRLAMPVGSARMKREQYLNMSLNAYGGAFLGKENIEGFADNAFVNTYGITAPVGIAVSLGKIRFCRRSSGEGNKSLTLFLSVIDVGTPVSFRFRNDTLNEIPKISFRDILAPGAHLILGFGRSPLSFSVGWQTGTNLRSIRSGFNEYSNSQSARFSAALLVDIPLLNVYSRKIK